MSDDDKKKGLYRRYKVQRVDDKEGKHDKCFFFVMDLDHDPFAIPALATYIEHCKKEYPVLAAELALQIVLRTQYNTSSTGLLTRGGVIDVRPK